MDWDGGGGPFGSIDVRCLGSHAGFPFDFYSSLLWSKSISPSLRASPITRRRRRQSTAQCRVIHTHCFALLCFAADSVCIMRDQLPRCLPLHLSPFSLISIISSRLPIATPNLLSHRSSSSSRAQYLDPLSH